MKQGGKELRDFATPGLITAGNMFLFNLLILVFSVFTVFLPFVSDDVILRRLFLNFLGQIGSASLIIFGIIPFFQLKQRDKEAVVQRRFLLTALLFCVGFSLVISNNFFLRFVWNMFQVEPKSSYEGITIRARHLADPFSIVMFFSTLTIGAAIFEEYVFRRTLIPALENRGFSPIAAVFASALVFGLSHLPNDLLNGNIPYTIEHFLSVFVLGLILGISFIQTRHVIYPIFLHGFYNGFSGLSTLAQLLAEEYGSTSLLSLTVLLLFAFVIIGIVTIIYGLWKVFSESEPAWITTFKKSSQGRILWGTSIYLLVFLTFVSLQALLPNVIQRIIGHPLLYFLIFLGAFVLLTWLPFYLAKKLESAES